MFTFCKFTRVSVLIVSREFSHHYLKKTQSGRAPPAQQCHPLTVFCEFKYKFQHAFWLSARSYQWTTTALLRAVVVHYLLLSVWCVSACPHKVRADRYTDKCAGVLPSTCNLLIVGAMVYRLQVKKKKGNFFICKKTTCIVFLKPRCCIQLPTYMKGCAQLYWGIHTGAHVNTSIKNKKLHEAL